MTLLVRNEEDIIREQILFHLKMGVDHFIVTDNGSTDNTIQILKQFEECNLLSLLFEKEDDYSQSEWVTRMARLAYLEHHADWVINSDADEFWWPESGTLKDVINIVPPAIGVLKVQRYNFLPQQEQEGNVFTRMIIKDNYSTNHHGNPLPQKVCHRGKEDIFVEQGNHAVRCSEDLASVETDSIRILHFPMRSYKQFSAKIAMGGAAYERNTKLPENIGDGWRKLYKALLNGNLPEYYYSQIPDEPEIESGLRSGKYSVDTRLRDFLSSKKII